jgi:excisionase family DNA binding protein
MPNTRITTNPESRPPAAVAASVAFPPYGSIKDTVARSGLSRSTIYALLDRGELVGVKSGRRTLITGESLTAYFARLPVVPPKSTG